MSGASWYLAGLVTPLALGLVAASAFRLLATVERRAQNRGYVWGVRIRRARPLNEYEEKRRHVTYFGPVYWGWWRWEGRETRIARFYGLGRDAGPSIYIGRWDGKRRGPM